MRCAKGNMRGGGARSLRTAGRVALGAAVFLLASCFGLLRDLQESRLGELTIRVAEEPARNMAPSADLTPVGYDVSGTGPSGATFFASFTGSSATQQGLVFGDWTIVVEGRNAEGTIVTFGTAGVKVTTGTTQAVDITMRPVVGPGTIALSVSWNPADVPAPTLQSQLVPSQGTAYDLAFNQPASGQASCSNSTIPNGYYTLVVKLLDNGQLVAGAVDTVRIVADATTSGAITFTRVNKGTGSILVNITMQMNAPVPVTMAGQAAERGTGQAMTVTASVPAALGNATYVWYLNGVSVGVGSSITLNTPASPMSPRTYRLDVCGFVSGGSRAGSATCTFEVTPTAQVTLEWDPNTETDLAGYRIYVGTASGVYGAPIDVGLATTYTVTNLQSGHTYYFAVSARNAAGQESGKSNEVVYAAPQAP
jgi:hypothetical protein